MSPVDSPNRPAELQLRAVSAGKDQIRSRSLYAFSDRTWAQKYFLGKKGFLYELEVDGRDIRHSADMMIVNDIAATQDAAVITALIQQYWNGDDRGNDRVEVLVAKATVRQCLLGPADKVRLKQTLYGNP